MVRSCGPTVPADVNPGVLLGTVLGVGQRNGRDKVTLVCSPAIYDFGAWAEQLLAESTGKEGKGLVPIDGEPLVSPDEYGKDRVFVYLRVADQVDPAQERAIDAIEKSGQPVVRITLNGHMEIVQQFFMWEFAVAVAGSFIGIDAFNQPDVEASKVATRKLTDEYNDTGKLPEEKPILTEGALSLFADERNAGSVRAETLDEAITKHFARLGSGDYAAVLAYIERNKAHRDALQDIRAVILNRKHVATVGEFGPRFLHSTGQAYKGGPNSGVFLQITASATRSASSRRRRRAAISTCSPNASGARSASTSPATSPAGSRASSRRSSTRWPDHVTATTDRHFRGARLCRSASSGSAAWAATSASD
jgi:transaldolase/glucose-6-phosphate isomerase